MYPPHCKGQGYTHRTVLRGVGCDVFEGPLDVLVLGQLPGEVAGVHAAQTQQAIVGRQHAAVEQHDLLVLMVSPAQTAPHTAQLVSTTHIAPSGQHYTHRAPSGQYYTNSTSWSVLHKRHLVSTIQTAPAGQYYTNTIWSVLHKQHQLISTTQTARHKDKQHNVLVKTTQRQQYNVLVKTTQRQQYNVLVKTTQRQSDLPVLLIGWGGAHVRHICE